MKKTVLLDTNFLLIPGQFGVDIFAELERVCDFSFEPAVLAATIWELEKIVSDKNASAKDRKAASLGLALINAKGINVIGEERKVFKSTDKAILDLAKESSKSVIVATQDKELKGKLVSAGVSVIVLRQKQHLVFQ